MKTIEKKYRIIRVRKYIKALGINEFYFRLETIKSGTVLYVNDSLDKCFIECWRKGIRYNEVEILN